MANTNLTFSTPIIDFLGCAYPAVGIFRTEGGHSPIAEVYSHTSAIPTVDNTIDVIGDVLLIGRSSGLCSVSLGQEIPIVIPIMTMSTYATSLNYSAVMMATSGVIELSFDAVTTAPTTMKMGIPYPAGSLQNPL